MDAHKSQRHHRHLDYNDLAKAVEDNENMYFLQGNIILCAKVDVLMYIFFIYIILIGFFYRL